MKVLAIWAGLFISVLVLITVMAIIMAFPFMLLWNYAAVGALTIAKPIGFWQSFWLLWLITWIFSNRARVESK